MNSRGGDSNGFPRERRIPMEPEEYDYEYDEHPDDEGGDANDAAADGDGNDDHNKEATGAEDAVLDLAELEQLQEEAERMKGLGNKHMAAQVSSIVVFVAKISLCDWLEHPPVSLCRSQLIAFLDSMLKYPFFHQ